MKYLSGASSGTVIAGGNGQGFANTQLTFPMRLYFDSSSSSLFIANSVSHNILRWVIGALSWTLIAGNNSGIAGSTSTLHNQPQAVVLDSTGNVFVRFRLSKSLCTTISTIRLCNILKTDGC